MLTVRVSESDVHYAGNLVDGAYILKLFGDSLTLATAINDGDEGLLESYSSVSFRKPVYPGDFITINLRVLEQTRLKRMYSLDAFRIARASVGNSRITQMDAFVDNPELIASATAWIVVPFRRKRERKE